MKRIAIVLFSVCLASGVSATFAADKGSMPAAKSDSMAKDSMAKDSMAAQSPPKSNRKIKDKTKGGMAHDAAKDKAAPAM